MSKAGPIGRICSPGPRGGDCPHRQVFSLGRQIIKKSTWELGTLDGVRAQKKYVGLGAQEGRGEGCRGATAMGQHRAKAGKVEGGSHAALWGQVFQVEDLTRAETEPATALLHRRGRAGGGKIGGQVGRERPRSRRA